MISAAGDLQILPMQTNRMDVVFGFIVFVCVIG